MNKKSVAVIVIASTVISSCIAEDIQPKALIDNGCVDMSLPETQKIVHEKMYRPLKILVPTNFDEEYLRKRFGDFKVISEEIEDPYYIHPSVKPYKIMSEHWGFNGIILNVQSGYPHTSKNKKSYWLNNIIITKNKSPLKLPIKIGSTVDEVRCHLGKSPTDIKRNMWLVYSTSGVYTGRVDLVVYFDRSFLVKKLEFIYGSFD